MKTFKIAILLLFPILLGSCASKYQAVGPSNLNYNSQHVEQGISLEYKYDLLKKKYAKKEKKKDVRLVAVRIKNNSNEDVTFGEDIFLTYKNGGKVLLMPTEEVFSKLKQHPTSHLAYLLLSPISVYTTKTHANGLTETSNAFPIGLIVGPGLAAGNLIAASSANKKFKRDLREYDLHGKNIERGATVYGLVGIRANNYDALELRFESPAVPPHGETTTP